MNFDFADQINPSLTKLHFVKALNIAEAELRKIPMNDFHAVLDQSLLHQTDDLVAWIDNFYKKTSSLINVKAFYFEMNEFDINTETWYIDGFAYRIDGGLDLTDMDWLADLTKDTIAPEEFILSGYESLQNAFATVELETDELQEARDWCEQIIITRYMELMHAAHLKAKEKNLKWATIPLYFTEHSYDFIVLSR